MVGSDRPVDVDDGPTLASHVGYEEVSRRCCKCAVAQLQLVVQMLQVIAETLALAAEVIALREGGIESQLQRFGRRRHRYFPHDHALQVASPLSLAPRGSSHPDIVLVKVRMRKVTYVSMPRH